MRNLQPDPRTGASMTEYRASFDAAIRFSNGGDLTAHGFRVDVPSPDIDQGGIAALFVASLAALASKQVNSKSKYIDIVASSQSG